MRFFGMHSIMKVFRWVYIVCLHSRIEKFKEEKPQKQNSNNAENLSVKPRKEISSL